MVATGPVFLDSQDVISSEVPVGCMGVYEWARVSVCLGRYVEAEAEAETGTRTSAVEVRRHAGAEELECRKPLHIELGRVLLVLGSVHLCQLDVGAVGGQLGGSLGVLRGEGLAVAAPGRVELHQQELGVGDSLLDGIRYSLVKGGWWWL